MFAKFVTGKFYPRSLSTLHSASMDEEGIVIALEV
jgi:hypothetical protein